MKTRRSLLHRRFWSLFMAGSAAGLTWMATASWGDDPAPPTPAAVQGWDGILPERSPEDLSIESLERITAGLPESWKAWGTETTNLILDFYEQEYPTVESQQAALAALQVKLETMEAALADKGGIYRKFPEVRAQVNDLYGRLAARIDLIEAVLDTLTMDPQVARVQRLAPAYGELASALSAVQADLSSRSLSGGAQWLPWIRHPELQAIAANKDESPAAIEIVSAVQKKLASRETYSDDVKNFTSRPTFLRLESALSDLLRVNSLGAADNVDQLRSLLKELVSTTEDYLKAPTSEAAEKIRRLDLAIRETAPDGGQRILTTLRQHWFNYNLRVVAAEGLFNRFIGDSRQETDWINECIMGARVSGQQCTNANVSVDLQPSSAGARLVLKLDGTIRSNANAVTHPATIHTVGNHWFSASKPVIFDGDRFVAESARVWASANNQTVDATTKFSWIPLFGHIADNVAFNEAQSRQGEANALTIQRINSEVGSRLNREVDSQFDKANMELQNRMYGPLRKQGLYPQTFTVTSSDVDLTVNSRLMESTEIAGSRPAPGYQVPTDGVLVQLHESILSNGAERLGLNGKTMTENEVRAHLEERFTELLGREVDLPEAKPSAENETPQNNTLVFAEKDALRFVVNNGEVRIIIRAGLKREGGEDIPTHIIEVPLKFTPEGDEIKGTRSSEVAVRPAPGGPRVAPVEAVARQNVMRQTIQSALGDSTFKGVFDVKLDTRTLNLRIESIEAESGWLTITLR